MQPGSFLEPTRHGGYSMAQYNLSFLCSECGRFHPTKISLTLFDGPDRLKRLGDVYTPKALPSEVPQLLRKHVTCPVTRNSLKLDDNKLYLVPVDKD